MGNSRHYSEIRTRKRQYWQIVDNGCQFTLGDWTSPTNVQYGRWLSETIDVMFRATTVSMFSTMLGHRHPNWEGSDLRRPEMDSLFLFLPMIPHIPPSSLSSLFEALHVGSGN